MFTDAFSYSGIGAEIDEDELKGIASSDNLVFNAQSFDDLKLITNQIIEATCTISELASDAWCLHDRCWRRSTGTIGVIVERAE